MTTATAFWVEAPGAGALRAEEVAGPAAGEVLVRTLHSGISRGTESLVFRGEVPDSERTRMRAPFQEGDFPGPVKYGYLNVGVVEQGPPALQGRTVFTLFPHQSAFVVPESAVAIVPEDVPARRAVLAGAVETAVNVLWDAAPLVGRPCHGHRGGDDRLPRRAPGLAASRASRSSSSTWTDRRRRVCDASASRTRIPRPRRTIATS